MNKLTSEQRIELDRLFAVASIVYGKLLDAGTGITRASYTIADVYEDTPNDAVQLSYGVAILGDAVRYEADKLFGIVNEIGGYLEVKS